MNVIFVGEANPYGGRRGFDPGALFPKPPGCAGDRLRRILGLRKATYLGHPRLRRINLCGVAWSVREARGTFLLYLLPAIEQDDVVVMLGRRVASVVAPGVPMSFFRAWGEWAGYGRVVSLPHPSGRSRAWNRPGAVAEARALLRAEAPDIPWGEVRG